MKRLLLLIAVSIVWSGSVLQAQEYEYVPLVREGIEWGYKNGEIYRFIGEEIINGKVYKQLGNSSRDYPDSIKLQVMPGKRIRLFIACTRKMPKKFPFMILM